MNKIPLLRAPVVCLHLKKLQQPNDAVSEEVTVTPSAPSDDEAKS
ncbi:hypothetical protein [Serratia liquefaciens]|nr:hypothetical protein [Serratia liquefaciens]